ncbi:MAG: signal recognition particle protein Srp19, partial [Thermoplasmatales archaeon]|nr:signal recognition particle protein Srp19 [Thermoplasmatales archaeon]
MVSKKDKKIVLWLDYFDINNPRPVRRIPKKLAVHSPKMEKLEEAAKSLGLNPISEEVRYPRYWYKKTGRVLVDKKIKKTAL